MKLSLIYEATIEDIKNRIPIWTKKYNQLDNKLIELAAQTDPTNGKYTEWIIKNTLQNTIRLPEDQNKISKNLKLFHSKKSKLQEKDINQYTPSSLAKTLDQEFGLTKSERKQARAGGLQLPPGAELILTNGPYSAVKITSPEASSLLCSGTQWCTANEGTAKKYLSRGLLYLIYHNSERKYLVHFESDQFMDVYDNEVDKKIKFELVKLLEPATGIGIKNTPKLAYEYARDVIKGRLPKIEPYIIKDPQWAYDYAKDVIKDRWPEAEPYIIKDPKWAYKYALDIIKNRWLEAEPYIMKDPNFAYNYAHSIIKGRWPEVEPYIMKDPELACLYAHDIIKDRWPEAEPIIMKSPQWAYEYALHTINGRWPEAEPYIMKDPGSAFHYARYIIKGRWPVAEPHMVKDPLWAQPYARLIIKGRWPEAEPHIMKDPEIAYSYARDVIKGRWPEAEPYIMKDPRSACYYAKDIIKGRWLEAEPIIMKDPEIASEYLSSLK